MTRKGCIYYAQRFMEECTMFPECGHTDDDDVLPAIAAKDDDPNKPQGRPQKDDNELLDEKSTGRKRAAKLFPLDREAPCEWVGKKFLLHNDDFRLGPNVWMVGCDKGLQLNRHHGHDKSVLKNEEGNVWRICSRCHNKYHAMTDPTYPGDGHDFKPIELIDATPEELAARIMEVNAKAGPRSVYPND